MIRIFHGDDEFSISEAVRRARAAVGPEEVRDPNTTVLEGNFKPFDIMAAASSLPFLADRRLVLVYGLLTAIDSRSGGRGAEWDGLAKSLSELPGTSDVVFVEAGTKLRQNGRGMQAAGPGAEVREFTVPRGPALEAWVRDRFAVHSATASRDAVARIAWLAGSDLRLLDSEVQKLAVYAGEREVTQADVDAMVGEAREANIFTAVDAVLERRPGVAMRLMYGLLEDGTSVGSIIAMLARQVRIVILASALRQGGLPQEEIGRRAGVTNRYALEKALRQASRFSPEYLSLVHRRLLEADMAIKTGELDEKLALEILVGRLSAA